MALLLACTIVFATAWGAAASELRVFIQNDCPHCAAFKAYMPDLQRRRPDLRITLIAVDTDPAAQQELAAISRKANAWPPGVPTFVIDGRVQVGFGDPASSGPELLAFVQGNAPPGQAGNTAIEAGPLGSLSVQRLGLPLFSLALGLLDGFNPCAMWVLLFLLSLLVHFRSRRRMALVAGTFVLVSGLVYFLFLAAWLNLFLAIGFATPIRVSLALLALLIGVINLRDSATKEADYHISIPARAKPGLYARMRSVLQSRSMTGSLLGVAALAVVVNLVELLCTAGLPAIFTGV
ncbi:MAG: glutaredoxin family protein, partial [Prochlorococcaceae cyanobacterium]